MTEVIVFPDAEALIIDHLRDALDENGWADVPVARSVPNPRPDTFLTVRRVGGVRMNLVADNPTLTFEAWAKASETAHDLAQHARALVLALPGQVLDGVPIYAVRELGGPVDLPDPISEVPRYTFTMTVAVRGTAFTGS